MKTAKLVHNPTAGDEEFGKKEIMKLIEEAGYECRYSSTKKEGWDDIEPKTDFIVVAGGDGTIKKVIEVLLERKIKENTWPIALLPLGTANNIAKTLKIPAKASDTVQMWKQKSCRHLDIGRIEVKKEVTHFLEAIGFGIFPKVIKKMKLLDDKETPEEELLLALQIFREQVINSKAATYNIQLDGKDYSGEYVMVEIMNIRSVGPNVVLAPHADPGDGLLEVVMITEADKESLAEYLQSKIDGLEVPEYFHSVRAHKIIIETKENSIHIDDKLVDDKIKCANISILERAFDFLVPQEVGSLNG